MNFRLLFGLLLVIFLGSCKSSKEMGYEVLNNEKITVSGKSIVLNRSEVEKHLKKLPKQEYAVKVINQAGKIIPAQVDDMNGDGKWDELVFQSNFTDGIVLKFRFEPVSPEKMPKFEKKTNIHFAYKEDVTTSVSANKRTDSSSKYQFDGPGWENDIVGFRNYYMIHNGMDIFGKRIAKMKLKEVGRDGKNYQELQDWGMDILHVGSSLGAGAIALGFDGGIYRIGECKKAGFEILATGPVRSVIELKYDSAIVGNRVYDITHRISIYAGDHFYRSQVWVGNLTGDEVLYTGIADFQNLSVIDKEENNYRIIANHGNQAYLGEKLGMGLIIPKSQFFSHSKAPIEGEDITQTLLCGIELKSNKPSEYFFFVGWIYQDIGFKSVDYFIEKLNEAILKIK